MHYEYLISSNQCIYDAYFITVNTFTERYEEINVLILRKSPSIPSHLTINQLPMIV